MSSDAIVRPARHGFVGRTELTVIEAGKRRWTSRGRELLRYRELLLFLAWRDVQVRYKQTLLGVLWAILQPLLTMVLFTVFFGRLARMPSEGIPYAVFAYAGLLPWTFFSTAISSGANSLISNPDLITKVYVPRLIVPAAAVLASMVDFAIAFILIIPLMWYYRIPVRAALLMAPLLMALLVLLAVSVASCMAGLNVKYRDVRHALPFAIQLWMFVSPVIYPSTLLPPRWRPLLMLNPLTGVIEGFRSSLFGAPFHWRALATSSAMAVAVALFAAASFERMEAGFADLI